VARASAADGSRMAERLGHRLNPLLVKEVRQALRGNFFRYSFWTTVCAATVIGVILIVGKTTSGDEAGLGRQFISVIFACMAAGVHGLVPLFAFSTMGNEWEENTYDLLVLSNLKPRQIVLGKLLSAGTLALLFYSAFVPFLLFAFLLPGVDLLAVAFLLGGSPLYSLSLAAVSVAMSTLARGRVARLFLLFVLIGLLVSAVSGSIGLGTVLIEESELLRDREFWLVIGLLFAGILQVAAFAFAVGCAQIAHAEENTSTGPRVLTIGIAPLAALAIVLMHAQLGSASASAEAEIALATYLLGLFAVAVASLFYVSEPERLGRRARLAVSRARLRSFLMAPFLPGGGRGFTFFLVAGGALFAAVSAVRVLHGTASGRWLDDASLTMLAALLYAGIYLGLPSALLATRTARPRVVVAARVGIVALVGAGLVVPTLGGFLVGQRQWAMGEHLGNPAWVLEEVAEGRAAPAVLLVLGLAFLVTLVLNARRIVGGFAEIQEHARSTHLRRAARAAARSPGFRPVETPRDPGGDAGATA